MAVQQLIIIVLFLYPIKSNISGTFNKISHIFDRTQYLSSGLFYHITV